MSGLGSRYWGEVIEVLRSIIPVYDKVNRVISLGKDGEYRLRGISGRVLPGNTVLDAGSGYGNMTRIALQESRGSAQVVMYDPIPEMLSNVRSYFSAGVDNGNGNNNSGSSKGSLLHAISLSSGIFEYMPFRDNTFDAVMCGYSLRDAILLPQAISEMHRVLKAGGRLVIVDLGKPDGALARSFVSFYLKYVLGIFAFVIAGKAGLKFRTLYGTYLRWPRNSELDAMLKDKFSRVEFERAMMGGAVIVAAYK